ncbi:hypothetical protein AB0J43_46305 [Nonomuraea fuscirosea]
MATAKERALAAWQALNERQQLYLRVIYRADQEAEEYAKGAWTAGGQSRPASEWRWLSYGPVGNSSLTGTGPLQDRLAAQGVRDQGAGSTLRTLEQAKLIETRQEPAVIAEYLLSLQLTRWGRQVARAGGVDPARARSPKRGMLSQGLWTMLAEVWAADGDGGHPAWHMSMAWERLTGREPQPYVQARQAPPGSRYAYRMHLTEAGREHYRQWWSEYARCYPEVDAPPPDGPPRWQEQVDQSLAGLRSLCRQLRGYLTDANTALEQLATLPDQAPPLEVPLTRADPSTPPADVKASLARRDRAAQAVRRPTPTEEPSVTPSETGTDHDHQVGPSCPDCPAPYAGSPNRT